MKIKVAKYKSIIINIDEVFNDAGYDYYNSLIYAVGAYGTKTEAFIGDIRLNSAGIGPIEIINEFYHKYGLRLKPEIALDTLKTRFANAVVDSIINADGYKHFMQMQRGMVNAKWVFVSILDDELLSLVAELIKVRKPDKCVFIGGSGYEDKLEEYLGESNAYKSDEYIGLSARSREISVRLGVEWVELLKYAPNEFLILEKNHKKKHFIVTLRLLNLYHRYPNIDQQALRVIDRYLPPSESDISDIRSMFLIMMASSQSISGLCIINNSIRKLPDKHKLFLTRVIVAIMQGMPIRQKLKQNIKYKINDSGETYHVSLICPFDGLSKSSHSTVIMGHLKALLLSDYVTKITMIFTCESSARIWGLSKTELAALSHDEIKKLSFPDGMSSVSKYLSKIIVVHAPKPSELYDNLGDVVFRFEGVSSRLSHQLYLRSIYACRPVITITFSSHVRTGALTDLILSRHKIAMPREFTYTHPYGKSLVIDVMENSDSASNTIIITAYGGPRIAAGLRNISSDAWGKLDSVFSENRDMKWFLVGVNDVDSALSAINKSFLAKHGDRLSIMPYSNLEELYKKAKIFLTLPNTFGGGGGATMALARAVPLVACKDTASDISNSLPDHLLTDTYEDALDFLSNLLTNKILYVDVVKQQQSHLKSRMDLSDCSNEMLASINEAIIRYARRQPILIDDNRPASNN